MSEGKDPADGRPSLRRFGAAFLGLLHGHVELFGIELQEQKANTLRLLLFAGLALVFALPALAEDWPDTESSPFSATLEELANDRERLLP